MKRILVLMMVIGLVFASIATADAKKKKKPKPVPTPVRIERVAEAVYDAPALGTPSAGGVCLAATNSCAAIPTGADDQFVKVTLTDATGTPVAFTLGQDTDTATLGTEVQYGDFCGTTGDTAIPIEAVGVDLLSFVWAFGDAVCPGGVATTGTVTATFSNMP